MPTINNVTVTEIYELEIRVKRAKQILKFIMNRDAKEGLHDNDIERVYKVLDRGAKYERLYELED